MIVGVLYEAPISPPWTANIISSISLVPFARLYLARKTHTMSTKVTFTVITTTLRDLLKDATAVILPFSSSLSKYSAMARINTGILSAT
jgi:hypothetical protein